MVTAARTWDFSRLTPAYWVRLIQTVLATGSNDIVQRNHPIPAEYLGEKCPMPIVSKPNPWHNDSRAQAICRAAAKGVLRQYIAQLKIT